MLLKMLLFAVVLPAFAFAQVNVSNPFNCQTEYILYNATSQLYTGLYDGCSQPPVLMVVNQTNITVVNETVIANYSINLTTFSCDNTSLLQSFHNSTQQFIQELEGRFNITGLYAECRYNRDVAINELGACTDRYDNLSANAVDRAGFEQYARACESSANQSAASIASLTNDRNNYSLGALALGIGIAWLFFFRRSQPERGEPVSPQGVTPLPDSMKIDSYMEGSKKDYDLSVEKARQVKRKLRGQTKGRR